MQKFFFYLIGSVLILSGCYTVIQHPEVKNTAKSEFSHQVYFTDNCVSCHGNAATSFNATNQPYLPRLDYIRENDNWNYYYQFPWWYRDRFYQYSGSGAASEGSDDFLPTTSSRPRFPGSGDSRTSQNNSRWITGGTGSSSTTKMSQENNKNKNSNRNSNSKINRRSTKQTENRKANDKSRDSDSNKNNRVGKRDKK